MPKKIEPQVLFFTGLSGAGKTTIAKAVEQYLLQKNINVILLDGDEIRNKLQLNNFDEASRKNHNLNVGYMASLLEKQGAIVLVALIAPYKEIRNRIRMMCNNYKEIFINTPIDICIQRDTKGLYAKAKTGEIKNFTGISAPYELPINAEIILDTSTKTVEECVTIILKEL